MVFMTVSRVRICADTGCPDRLDCKPWSETADLWLKVKEGSWKTHAFLVSRNPPSDLFTQ